MRTVSSCYDILHQLGRIRRSEPRTFLQTLISSLVFSQLDFSNATLSGISGHLVQRLQSMMNAAARMIRRRASVTFSPLRRQLHWLNTRERIDYKLAVLVCKCLHQIIVQLI